jgi:nitroreductase
MRQYIVLRVKQYLKILTKKSPKPILGFLRRLLALAYVSNDVYAHFRFSAPEDGLFSRRLKASSKTTILEKDLHRIEKALSLANAKRSFGAESAYRIQTFLRNNSESNNSTYILRSKLALEARDRWTSDADRANGMLTEKVSPFADNSDVEVFDKFFKSRRSIRNFAKTAPTEDQISKAIAWSINTPSVCNRQGWHVWYVTEPKLLEKILRLQNGNSGFDNLNAILIFGGNRKKYTLGSERNQIWIDGGLFAMSTVWALHAQGLGTCFLNWATSPRKTQKLRNLIGASRNIEFTTLCAVGAFESNTLVAISPRKPPSQYVEFLK